ncbi:efflux RND transporter periplasmic adaptor subunit [Halobacillus sp. B23F22_1]|uniref:efflux RND transporter periplasmic adaptor subunit n=1 Tax=Halobacillus sp. B23F22_1 TaxID=3459514 RepID=UPI00373EC232
MKRKIFITVIIVFIVVVFSFNVLKAKNTEDVTVEVIYGEEEEVKETLSIPGVLELKNEEKIYSETEKGTVKEVFVKAGEKVKQGDPVLEYEDQNLSKERRQHNLSLQSVELSLESLYKQKHSLQDQIHKAKEDKEVVTQLTTELDQVEFELHNAQIEKDKIMLELETLNTKEEELEVTSPIDGTVLTVNLKGSQDMNEPMVTIANLSQYSASGVVGEDETVHIKENDEAVIQADVIDDKKWAGEVKSIGYTPVNSDAVEVQDDRASKQYAVDIEFTEDEQEQYEQLKPGFKLLIDIILEKRRGLTIPRESVVCEGQSHTVFVVEDGKAVSKEVEYGVRLGEKVEVISGLTGEDAVVRNPEHVKEGMEVEVSND